MGLIKASASVLFLWWVLELENKVEDKYLAAPSSHGLRKLPSETVKTFIGINTSLKQPLVAWRSRPIPSIVDELEPETAIFSKDLSTVPRLKTGVENGDKIFILLSSNKPVCPVLSAISTCISLKSGTVDS